jgi:hypothetical protein
MNVKLLSFCWALILIQISIYGCNATQTNKTDQRIISRLKAFYTGYIIQMEKLPDKTKIDSLISVYCSSDLIKTIESKKLDYDPFLKAQDCDIAWLKTLTISKNHNRECEYRVSFLDSFKGEPIEIMVKVVSEKGVYKIDSVF